MNLKISIIIPSYNQGEYIGQTIESIIRQEYNNYEIIVADAKSSDNTLDVLKKYKERLGDKFTYLYEKDKGFADAVNKGLKLATGDILAIQSSDDLYAPNAFKTIVPIFEKSNPLMVAGERINIDDSLNIISHLKLNGKMTLENFFKLEIAPYQDATFFSREAYENTDGLWLDGDYVGDFAFWIKILAFGDGVVINEILSYYRVQEDQRTQTNSPRFGDDFEKVVYKWLDSKYYKNVENKMSKDFIMAGMLLRKAYWYNRGGKKVEAGEFIKEAINKYPISKEIPATMGAMYRNLGLFETIKVFGLFSVLQKKLKNIFNSENIIEIELPDPKEFLK